MYAVIQTGGKQYRVAPGQDVQIEKLPGVVGDAVTFDQVLLTSDGEAVRVGQPLVESSKVLGRILRQAKAKKVMVVKFKRRKDYRRKRGHRQPFTLVRIETIEG
jgi:large subunit ribosomal protein L21